MKNPLAQMDYRVYRMARMLSEHLELGELLSVVVGSLDETEDRKTAAPVH
ncbi:MAG: hypothetical protein Q6K80_09235 [Thermostichus sp. DG_1_6_bins_120]